MKDSENDPVCSLLEGLKPASPSDALLRRLTAMRPVPRQTSARDKVILFIPRFASAAALLALAGAVAWKFYPRGGDKETLVENTPGDEANNTSAVASILPLQSRQRLLGVKDLGVVRDAGQGAVRLMQASWSVDETFSPPDGAPPVRQERVREEIVPLEVTTF